MMGVDPRKLDQGQPTNPIHIFKCMELARLYWLHLCLPVYALLHLHVCTRLHLWTGVSQRTRGHKFRRPKYGFPVGAAKLGKIG